MCDILPEAMGGLLSKYGPETESSIVRYTDYMTMLDEIRPKLVSIATESGIHAEIALACVSCIIGVASGGYLWKYLNH